MPAETPPSSYSGEQYVDSQGCVFVRVGYGSATEWVPRVGRDRRQLCGYQPTRVAGAGPAPGSVDPANPGPGVTVIGGPATAVAAVSPATPPATVPTAAQPRTVIRQTPAAVSTPGIRVLPAPTATAPAAARPATPTPPPTEVRTTCPGLTGLTAQYLSGPGVRCGPQAVHPGDAARGIDRAGAALNPASYNGQTLSSTGHLPARIVPPPAPERVIPEGYVQVWDDGRINPLRGIRHVSGEAEMAMVWTDTVPRRLVAAE
ncbi:hypothetical protein KUV65_17405 [Maritalea mobilis]|uniref:hypothetical protein n=1 Tax=Maritalea mobilis TaxID=483324 RepID=UPI001C9820A0|nr:hypothetical protein [Maritalea mobilis]MBY6203150.1 hypothetical protein [Maritalea mobilis]